MCLKGEGVCGGCSTCHYATLLAVRSLGLACAMFVFGGDVFKRSPPRFALAALLVGEFVKAVGVVVGKCGDGGGGGGGGDGAVGG